MKTTSLASSALCLLAASSTTNALPTARSRTQSLNNNAAIPNNSQPWQVFSLREQPFWDAELSFYFLDPNTKYETSCKTKLPMSGYGTCEDKKTTFIYGGVSFQYGETWLSVQRPNIQDCQEVTDESGTAKTDCKERTASGTLNLPNNFWQQPGWNSWVHPEQLYMNWGYST